MTPIREFLRQTPLAPLARAILRPLRKASTSENFQIRDTGLALAYLRSHLPPTARCVDAGANRGEWISHMKSLAPDGEILAFEPLPYLAKYLKRRFPDVEIHELALSDSIAEADFIHAVSFPGWSGLRQQRYPRKTPVERLSVKTARLDAIVGDRRIDFIKIDVEGAEHLVVNGARETITRCRPIILFELANTHIRPYGISASDVWDLFRDMGMNVSMLSGEPLPREVFVSLADQAEQSDYGPNACGNFFAKH